MLGFRESHNLSVIGLGDQSQEIMPAAFSGGSVHWYSPRFSSRQGLSPSRQPIAFKRWLFTQFTRDFNQFIFSQKLLGFMASTTVVTCFACLKVCPLQTSVIKHGRIGKTKYKTITYTHLSIPAQWWYSRCQPEPFVHLSLLTPASSNPIVQ